MGVGGKKRNVGKVSTFLTKKATLLDKRQKTRPAIRGKLGNGLVCWADR